MVLSIGAWGLAITATIFLGRTKQCCIVLLGSSLTRTVAAAAVFVMLLPNGALLVAMSGSSSC
jgi:hypothetical protein